MRQRILLLSAYQADSHAWWTQWLEQRFADIDWRRLTLPGRHFKWRIRGNPLSWIDRIAEASAGVDRVLATSMVDLATLRGLHPALAAIPTDYYFHENQFAYPVGPDQRPSLEPQIVQLYGALAADRLLFNSEWNRRSFLDGVAALLRRMPDAVPAGIVERLAPKTAVVPVPIAPPAPGNAGRDAQLILWNHRWEYDKAPAVFADALIRLAEAGYAFRLALLGPRPHPPPPALTRLVDALGDRIVANGHRPRRDYEALLQQAGVVVSTAIHEFQGLGMLEATAAGATPLVPDALVYPEQYPLEYRYPAGDADALAQRLAAWLTDNSRPAAPDVSAWYETALQPLWQQTLSGSVSPDADPGGGSRPCTGDS
jgi:glycosyltransferase involved in cell wall biosynthesis